MENTLLQQILAGQAQIIKKLDNIENNMVTKEVFEKSMGESQQDIKTLLEITATKDSITTLSAAIDVLNTRTFQQETKLRLIETSK
jgi:hypothetical protein